MLHNVLLEVPVVVASGGWLWGAIAVRIKNNLETLRERRGLVLDGLRRCNINNYCDISVANITT